MRLCTLTGKIARQIHRGASSMRQHSLLLPLIISFLCFIGSVLLILSIWFSRDVAITLKDALYADAAQSSAQAVNHLNISLQSAIHTVAHLTRMDELAPRVKWDFYETYKAYQTLKKYNTTFDFSLLAICYDGDPKVISTDGVKSVQVLFQEVTQLDKLTKDIEDTQSVSLLCTAMYGADQSANRLMLLYPLSSRHVAIFFFDNEMLSSLTLSDETEGIRVLFDHDGSVLWSSERIEEQTCRLLFDSLPRQEGGSRELKLQGVDYIYSDGSIFYGNALLVVLDEVTTQFDRFDSILRMMVVICVAIALLGILLLFFSIWRGYMPIAHLVRDIRGTFQVQQEHSPSDISMLQQVYSDYSVLLQESREKAALFSTDQLRSLAVLHIINGRYQDMQELHNLCLWLDIDFPHPCFFSCLLLFDRVSTTQERKCIEEYLEKSSGPDAASLFNLLPNGQMAVGVINVPSTDSGYQRRFGERMLAGRPAGLSVTIGMGEVCEDITSLGKSYIEAHAALDYRLIKGKNTWINYEEIHFSGAASDYPRQIINGYISALHAWYVQGIREKLQQIADYIYENSLPLQQVKCICFDLTSSLLREISLLDKHVTYQMNAAYDVFNIAEYDSVPELIQKISEISETVCQYIQKRDAVQGGDLVSQCMRYLQENISNVQFSLSSCSERFKIAPQTLRRKFKEATGQTLSSYFTTLRIGRAKELLVTTSLDVNEICTQCGYLDLSSFIRLFKSEVGVSPGRFREMNREDQSALG